MAFVGGAALAPSARTAFAGNGLPLCAKHGGARVSAASRMMVEFQSYSGGLDRVSVDPYSITRYLFKSRPATLTDEEKDCAIAAGLRQIFGNAYLMEEERAELYPAESKFRCGQITAKEFVRAVAKSSTYKTRFFDRVTQFRFIELNFKHLLGRAPLDQVEYSKHFKIFAEGGYEAEIDSYFDDGEYDDVFGEDILPFTRFRGTYAPINQFNRMCTLEGGFAGSDKFKPQMLVTSLAANIPTATHCVADGLPPIPNSEHPSKKYFLPTASLERFRNELEVANAKCLELELELRKAYEDLNKARATVSPFQNMVAEMSITELYGKNYGTGSVKAFSGQYIGAPTGKWGASGVESISGPTRQAAKVIAKKEKKLESVKQLIVDIERQITVLESVIDAPVFTPEPQELFYTSQPVPVIDEALQKTTTQMTVEPTLSEGLVVVGDGPVDPEDEESGMVVPKKVVISTKRRFDDEVLGKNPGDLIKEIEEEKKANGKDDPFAGRGDKKDFPGDGSEMIVGG